MSHPRPAAGDAGPDPAADPPPQDDADRLPPTYLRGRRTGWLAAPQPVRDLVTEVLAEPVLAWEDRVGGMSVGVASVVHGANRSVFVKALDGVHNPAGHEMYRREAATAPLLPRSASVPRLLHDAEVEVPGVEVPGGEVPGGEVPDSEVAGGRWAVNVFEAVPGEPPSHPWTAASLRRVLDAWAELTPALHATRWETSAGVGTFLGRWRRLVDGHGGLQDSGSQHAAAPQRDDQAAGGQGAGGQHGGDPAGAGPAGGDELVADPDDPWRRWVLPWRDRLERVTALLDGSPEHPAVLIHGDLRADNLLLEPEGSGVWFADWAQPGLAAPWVDPAILFADVLASGADLADGGEVDVEQVWCSHPATAAYELELLRAGVVTLAAALHLGSQRPPNPLFPHQRGWERAMADQLVPYLRRHT